MTVQELSLEGPLDPNTNKHLLQCTESLLIYRANCGDLSSETPGTVFSALPISLNQCISNFLRLDPLTMNITR